MGNRLMINMESRILGDGYVRFGGEYMGTWHFLKCQSTVCLAYVTRTLTNKANSPQFYEYLHNRIMEHISIEDDKLRPYVFLYGIGSMYPYMRTSSLLASYEQYNKSNKYKIIVFYPGEKEGNTFRLFNRIDDEHTYRAILLIND